MLQPKTSYIIVDNKKLKNHGDKYQTFLQCLSKVFTHSRAIYFKKNMAKHIMMEKVIMLAILQRKSDDYYNIDKFTVSQQLHYTLKKYRKAISEKMGMPEEEIEKIEKKLDFYLNQLMSINHQKNMNVDEYLYNLVLTICDKKQQKGFFGGIKEIVYTKTEFDLIGKEFNVKINFMNYDKSDKKLTKQFENPNESQLYIIIAKDQYYFLYCKNRRNLNAIEVVDDKVVKMNDVEKIFARPSSSMIQSHKEQSMSEVRGSAILFPTDINCENCHKKCPQFDCLFWNYQYLCGECVVDVSVDTSHIPGPIILKYCQQRQLTYKNYEKMCPECTGLSLIKSYNPVKKPKKFICDICTKTICIKHSCNIYQCFCFCSKCHVQTLFIPTMKINYCQNCRDKYCFNCQTKSKKFCSCICEKCLNQNSPNHQCEPSCHRCLNSPAKMKNCQCGLIICYGCYYYLLKENGKYTCQISDYV